MTGLTIAEGLTLDTSYVTKVAAVIAQRRKGKTYTASVIAEELVAAQLPFLVVDPTGAWWGLRASADARREGLPVTILGGQHGDLPIDRHAGGVVADLVIDHPGWYIADLSLFDSHEAERTFVRALLERLYRRKGQAGNEFPLHVIIDEADLYAPQQPQPGDQQMLGAFKTLVKRGGIRGIGATVITQRPASLSKHVLEQIDVLIMLRIVGPNDRRAVDDYVKDNATADQREQLMSSLASLRLGEAWVWEPGAEPPMFRTVQIRQRRTFNSSATPEVGQQRVEPKRLAAVDLEAVKQVLAETLERAEHDDPHRLRERIAELQRNIQSLKGSQSAETQRVDVLVAPAEYVTGMLDAQSELAAIGEQLHALHERLDAAGAQISAVLDKVGNLPMRAMSEFTVMDSHGHRREAAHEMRATAHAVSDTPPPARSVQAGQGRSDDDGDTVLLDTLAWFASVHIFDVERRQLALFAGVSPRSSSYSRRLASLLAEGLIDYPQPGYVTLTDAGRARARPMSRITTNEQMHAELYRRLPSGQARLLRVLVDAEGSTLSRGVLADHAGVSLSSSSFSGNLAALYSLGLIDYPAPGFVAATGLLWLELEGR